MKSITIGFLVLLSGVLSGQSSINLQLKWWNQFQFAGYYAAQKQGYYSEEGLVVNIQQGGRGICPVEEVTSERSQFGVSGSDLILQYAEDQSVIALGAVFQHSPYTFMSLKESNILSPSDLVGKTVMVCDNQGWAEMSAALKLQGISTDSINIIDHSWNNADLVQGKAEAISAYSTVEPWQLAAKGYQTNLLRPINYGIDFYGDILFTSRNMLLNEPETVEKFRRASFRGWQYALTHVEEMIDYILSLPNVKERGITREQLLWEAEAMQSIIMADIIEVGHMNTGRWEHILSTYKLLGLAKSDATLGDFVYDENHTERSTYIRKLLLAVGVVLLLSVTFLISYVIMKRVIRRTRIRLQDEINSRDQALNKLNTTAEYLDMAIKSATLGIWSLDVNEKSFSLGSGWKTSLGFDSEELKVKIDEMLAMVHVEDRKQISDSLHAHIDGRSDSFEGTMRIKTNAGGWKWIHTIGRAQKRDESGHATKVMGVHLDVDNIKHKETELIRISEELLKNNNDLRQFSYVISHNLRAPVASIAGLIQVIDPDLRKADQHQILPKIESCTMTLLSVMSDLNQILNNKNKPAESAENIYVQERVQVLSEMFGDQLEKICGKIMVDQRHQSTIWFPTEVFDVILFNLISNAIKFRDNRNLLHIDIFTRETEHFVQLFIRDNGIGIDLAQHGEKIFGLYQRFHPRTPGKGLGLYICKKQIEGLGGKIEVESIPEAGTTFVVSFPKELPVSELVSAENQTTANSQF